MRLALELLPFSKNFSSLSPFYLLKYANAGGFCLLIAFGI
jgi:hypothetical protein